MRTGLLMIVGFVLIPLLIQTFGFRLFGLFMLVQQMANAMVAPFRSAVTSTLVKSISEVRESDSVGSTSQIVTNSVGLLLVLAVFLLACTVVIVLYPDAILNFEPDQLFDLRLAIATEAVIIVMMIVTSPSLSLFLVCQRPILYNADLTIRRWLDLVSFGLAMLPFGWNIFAAFVLIRMVLKFFHAIARVLVSRHVMKEARIDWSLLDRSVMGRLLRLGGMTAAQPFTNFNFFVLDNYLLNLVFGSIYNGIYAIVNQLRGYARRFGSQVFVGTVAIAADIHERGNRQTNIKAMLTVSRITSGVMLLSTTLIVIFFRPLIDLWLGSRLKHDASLLEIMPYEEAVDLVWGMLSMLLIGGIFLESVTAASKFLYGMGLVKKYFGILFAAGILKFILSVSAALIMLYAVAGITEDPNVSLVFSGITLLCQLIFFGVLMPRRIVKLVDISMLTWWWNILVRPLMAAFVPALVGVVLMASITEWTWEWLIGSVLLVGMLCMPSSFFLLLERDERQRILKLSNRLPIVSRFMGRGRCPQGEQGDP
tara:strand:- start:3623 stop:5236 length:1614 start_codon:yes stop_codon:yes gene_type:complete